MIVVAGDRKTGRQITHNLRIFRICIWEKSGVLIIFSVKYFWKKQAILDAEPLTFVHGEQKYNPLILAGTENIGRVIDIEHSAKAQESEGDAHWAKLHNLQEQSKTFNYLTENGLLDSAKLDQDLADLSASYQQSKAELKATETRLKDVNRQLRLLGQYFKTKAVYREYLKGGKRKDFAAAHRSELELYDAVVKELRELFGDQKLPSVQSLKQERAQLTERKQAQYESYSVLRSQWLELSKLARTGTASQGRKCCPSGAVRNGPSNHML